MIVKINGNPLLSGGDVVSKPVAFKPVSIPTTIFRNDLILRSAGLVPLIAAYMGLSKYLAVGVIMFAGTAWMFGHRTKAIELIIGTAAGFLLILNAWDMVSFLEGLKAK